MPTPKQQYAKKLNEIARRYLNLEDEVARRSAQMLRDLRARIAAELATAQNFREFQLRQLQRNIDTMIAHYEAQLAAEVRAQIPAIYEVGGLSVVEPLRAIDVPVYFKPSRAQVNAILDFSADLVKDIVNETRQKINTQIRLAALGNKSPIEAMRGIDKELKTKAGKPIVGGVGARSESILRTEMHRVYSLANHSQQLDVAQRVDGLSKRWLATGDMRTRHSHLDAHRRYQKGPIPVNEPFILYEHDHKGRKTGKKSRLMFPGDPNGPPGETINCRCDMATIHPRVGVIGTPLDGLIGKEMKRRAA